MTDHAETMSEARQTMALGNKVGAWRLLELSAVFAVVVSVFGLLAMRLGIFQVWQIWILGVAGTYLYARRMCVDNRQAVEDPPAWHLLLVVGVALLFRLPVYVYQLGGQDQGVYANMAAYLLNSGGLEPADQILGKLWDPVQKAAYIQGNYSGGDYVLGVFATKAGLEFQFYHLFPVWLALFGGTFGVEHAAYALTFFSVLSLLFFQRLAHGISGNSRIGLAAGLLLAVNPLHAFFSKFSVTEIPTLAFSLMSFTFLLTYWHFDGDRRAARYLIVSLASMAMLFMTRITGFMYVPFFLLIFLIGVLCQPGTPRRAGLVWWAIMALCLYAASIVYGLLWSNAYAESMYRLSFAPVLGENWFGLLVVMGLTAAVACYFLLWLSRREPGRLWMQGAVNAMARLLPILVLLITAMALRKAYELGFTTAYSDQQRFVKFGIANAGLRSLGSVSLIASAIYLSPFVILAFWVYSAKASLTPLLKLLLFFVVCFYGYVALLNWVLFYQPYYARYLVSEFVPYLLLFVVCALAGATARISRGSVAVLLVAGLWCSVFTAMQIGKQEQAGVQPSLERLVSHFDPQDVVFVDATLTQPVSREIRTTLEYTHGLNVAAVRPADMAAGGFARALAGWYHDVYYISHSTTAPEGFVEVDSVDFSQKVYCHGPTPPTKLCLRNDSEIIIYRRPVSSPPLRGETVMAISALGSDIGSLVGTKGERYLAADGRPGFAMFGPYRALPAGSYSLVVRGTTSQPFTLDVVSARGAQTGGRQTYQSAMDPAGGMLAKLEFELPTAVQDVEIRVQVHAGSDLKVEGYQIRTR